MNPERWEFIEGIFHRLLELPPAERTAALEACCGQDAEMRAQVERLLRDDADATPDPLDLGGIPAALASDPMIGREFGAYRLISRLALGGMGVVYRAERIDGQFERDVAIKLIRPDSATAAGLRRFEFERNTLAGLNHPNIARLYDGGTTAEGGPYIVLEFVDGQHIDLYCAQAALSIEDRLRLFVTVCRAVHFAHKNLIVHRDLKPGNILVDQAGVPKLLDFGIARLVQEEGPGGSDPGCGTLSRLMTPEYASPEQFLGAALTTATDVYSLGVVLYGLLTGRKPFRVTSQSVAEWERIVTERTPARPSTAVVAPLAADEQGASLAQPGGFASTCRATPARLRRRISGDLDRIVLMALRKEPERRYSSAQEFADDIERHLAGEPVIARGDSALYRMGKFARRNRLIVASSALILLSLISGLGVARREEGLARQQAEHARIEADSFRSVSQFLVQTFLSSDQFVEPEERDALRANVLAQTRRIRRLHAEEPHLRANLLDSLGNVLATLDSFDDAEALLEEALAIRQSFAGEQSLEVALSLASLGNLHYRSGAFDEAVEELGRTLELHRTCPPGTHTDIATAANDLAVALRSIGRLDEAEVLHLEALELRRRVEPKGLAVAESLNNLAGTHMGRAEFDQADQELSEAVEIRSRLLGSDHPLTLQSLSNLANVAWYLGHRERARAMLEQAEDGFRALHVEGLEGLGRTLSSLTAYHTQEGRLEEAEACLAEALDVQTARLAADHPTVVKLLTRLANLRHDQGRNEEASEIWLTVVEQRRASSLSPHLELARTLQEYGVFQLRTGALEGAEAALTESVELLTSAPSADPALMGRAHLSLGVCLMRSKELERAESELRRGLQLLEATPGVPAQDVEEARQHVSLLEQARAGRGG